MIFKVVNKDYSPLFDENVNKLSAAYSVMNNSQKADNIISQIGAFDKIMKAYMDAT